MPIFPTSIIPAAAATSADPVVERGLRFEDGDTPYLTRTPGSAGNQKTWTFSCWAKRGNLTYTRGAIFAAGAFSYGDWMELDFDSADQLEVYFKNASYQLVTTQKFMDTSAWYHIVLAVDTTQTTDSNKVKIWVNGTQVTAFTTSTYPSVDDEDLPEVNSTSTHYIGHSGSAEYFDGSLADIYLLDGTAKAASDFGQENSNGQWVPKATSFSSGDYGGNGFHIDFVGGHNSELLLQSNHKQGSTNFEDSSGAGHYGITTSGDPQHSIKVGTPFTGDDRAVYFDGSGDYIQDTGTTSQSDWEPGTGEFCYEVWYRSASSSGSASATQYLMMSPSDSSDVEYINLRVLTDGTIKSVVGWQSGGYNGDQLASVNVHDGRWHHIALVRDNSGTDDALHIYVDGKVKSTYDTSVGDIDNFASGQGKLFTVGATHDGDTGYLHGYLFDFRATHGSRVYSGDFTPPTEKLSADSNTMLLIQPHKDDTSLGDESTENTKTITGYGDLSTVAPTASTPYDGVGERSAIYFDGDDYLSVPDSDDFSFGSGNFTIEMWVYFNNTGTEEAIMGQGDYYSSEDRFYFRKQSTDEMTFGVHDYDGSLSSAYVVGSTALSADTWYHVAVTRSGGTLTLYIDGTSDGSESISGTVANWPNDLWVGRDPGATSPLDGYLFDVRITKGEAKDPNASGYLDAPFESTAVIHPGGDSGKRNQFDVVNLGMGDVVRDCPESGGNFATLNSLVGSSTFSEGNLKSTLPTDNGSVMSNIALPSSGKWYCECYYDSAPGFAIFGVGKMGLDDWSGTAECSVWWNAGGASPAFDGTGSDFARGSDVGDVISFSTGSVIGVLWDADNDKISVTDGTNTISNTHTTIPSYPIGFIFGHSSSSDGTVRVNFGADASFAGAETGTPNTGGGGEWALTLPTGYKALKTDNLSTTSATTFSYVGNESTDGPFIYMGYRPSSVTIGGTDYVDGSYNPNDGIDWLANGIKIRTDALTINENGTSYSITAAPKELDFKYGTAR